MPRARLVAGRLEAPLAEGLEREFVPLLSLHWMDAALHHAAVAAWLKANRRRLSLVDCTSFEVMRRLELRQVFAFDGYFDEQGFEVLQV